MVGAPGFEPGTSCSQSRRATRLRHAPIEGCNQWERPEDASGPVQLLRTSVL